MPKTIRTDATGRKTFEEVATNMAEISAENAAQEAKAKKEELDYAEKGKIRKEVYESMLYGGSNFNDRD